MGYVVFDEGSLQFVSRVAADCSVKWTCALSQRPWEAAYSHTDDSALVIRYWAKDLVLATPSGEKMYHQPPNPPPDYLMGITVAGYTMALGFRNGEVRVYDFAYKDPIGQIWAPCAVTD